MSRWDGLTHEQRFLSRIDKNCGVFGEFGNYPTQCWNWTGCCDKDGYGRITVNNRSKEAHRFSYMYFIGKTSLDLDHLCRNHKCVNPEHLEPCTRKDNVMRGQSFSAVNARKTHCIHGHEYTSVNTYTNPTSGKRYCKTCHSARKS